MCVQAIAKCVLTIVNIVFLLLGVAIAAIGALAAFGQDIIKNIITPLMTKVFEVATVSDQNTQIQNMITFILDITKNVGIPLLCLGLFLIAVAVLGFIGANCVNALLYVYGIILCVLVLCQIVPVIMWYTMQEQAKAFIKPKLNTTMLKFNGLYPNTTEGLVWFMLQAYLGCCGIDSGSEWNSNYLTGVWNRTYKTINNLAYPYSCCKLNPANLTSPISPSCPNTFDATTSNIATGCLSKMDQLVVGYSTPTATVMIITAAVQIGIIVCAFCVAKGD